MQKEISRKKNAFLGRTTSHGTAAGERGATAGEPGGAGGWDRTGTCPLLVEHYCVVTLNEHLSLFTSVAFCPGVCGTWGPQCLPWSWATVEKASLLTSGFLLIPAHPPWSPEGILWLRTPLSPHHLQAWFRVLESEERKEFWHMCVVWKFQKGSYARLQQAPFEVIAGD